MDIYFHNRGMNGVKLAGHVSIGSCVPCGRVCVQHVHVLRFLFFLSDIVQRYSPRLPADVGRSVGLSLGLFSIDKTALRCGYSVGPLGPSAGVGPRVPAGRSLDVIILISGSVVSTGSDGSE